MTSRDQRAGSSTGTRVSTGRFGPASPKGGFASSTYDALKAVGEYYDYNPEAYYKQRLFGTSRDDVQWRYDLGHHLLGRPSWKNRIEIQKLFPTFGKKVYKASDKQLQESPIFRNGQLYSGIQQPSSMYGQGQSNQRTSLRDRRRCANRMYNQILRGSICSCKHCQYNMFHKLRHPVQTSRSNSYQSKRYRRRRSTKPDFTYG